MSMQSEGKDAKGRNWDQVTRDGTSSAGSMGTGGTGDIGAMGSENVGQGSQQSASRTDDLLAGDTTHQEADQAFSGGGQGGQIQTGMEGINSQGGNRQSAAQGGAGEQGAMPTSQTNPDQYDQGTAVPEHLGEQGNRQSGGQGSLSGEPGGNRQSGQQGGLNQQGSGGMRTSETDRDQGSSARE